MLSLLGALMAVHDARAASLDDLLAEIPVDLSPGPISEQMTEAVRLAFRGGNVRAANLVLALPFDVELKRQATDEYLFNWFFPQNVRPSADSWEKVSSEAPEIAAMLSSLREPGKLSALGDALGARIRASSALERSRTDSSWARRELLKAASWVREAQFGLEVLRGLPVGFRFRLAEVLRDDPFAGDRQAREVARALDVAAKFPRTLPGDLLDRYRRILSADPRKEGARIDRILFRRLQTAAWNAFVSRTDPETQGRFVSEHKELRLDLLSDTQILSGQMFERELVRLADQRREGLPFQGLPRPGGCGGFFARWD